MIDLVAAITKVLGQNIRLWDQIDRKYFIGKEITEHKRCNKQSDKFAMHKN